MSEIHREYSFHAPSYSNGYYDKGFFTTAVMQQEDGVYEEESFAKDLIQYDFSGEEKPYVTMYIPDCSARHKIKAGSYAQMSASGGVHICSFTDLRNRSPLHPCEFIRYSPPMDFLLPANTDVVFHAG